jgi:hypothetical protein
MKAAQLSQPLLAVWRQRDPDARWTRRAIALLVPLAMAVALAWLPAAAGWRTVVGMLMVVVFGSWLAVGHSLQEQNHPHAARCVPGQLRALRRAALLGWAACSVLTTLLAGAMLHPTDRWPLLLLATSLTSLFLLWSSRLWWLWLLVAFASPLSGAFSAQLAPLWRALAELWREQGPALLALGLIVQAGLVRCAFDAGGAAHQSRYAQRAQMRRAMQMQLEGKPSPLLAWAPLARLAVPFERAQAAWLRRVLARADNARRRSVMARADIALHGCQHWLRQSLTLGGIAIAVVLGFAAVVFFTGTPLDTLLAHGFFGLGIGIVSAGLAPLFSLPNTLWQSRREQALLRLLPGMPQGRELNTAVAALHWRDFSVSWLLTAAVLSALALRTGQLPLLCLPLAALPIAALALTRRPAFMRAPTALGMMFPMFALLLLGAAGYAAVREGLVALPALALATLVLSAATLAWRWRHLVAALAALPAGRR